MMQGDRRPAVRFPRFEALRLWQQLVELPQGRGANPLSVEWFARRQEIQRNLSSRLSAISPDREYRHQLSIQFDARMKAGLGHPAKCHFIRHTSRPMEEVASSKRGDITVGKLLKEGKEICFNRFTGDSRDPALLGRLVVFKRGVYGFDELRHAIRRPLADIAILDVDEMQGN